MLITRLKINNLYSFKDFDVDFTYPRKPAYTTIDNEFVIDRPNFNVKRVCIISGANATGKTSLGKVMCEIQNIISNRQEAIEYLEIRDKGSVATAEIEFVSSEDKMLHFARLIFKQDESKIKLDSLAHVSTTISKNDSVTSARRKLEKIKFEEEELKKKKIAKLELEGIELAKLSLARINSNEISAPPPEKAKALEDLEMLERIHNFTKNSLLFDRIVLPRVSWRYLLSRTVKERSLDITRIQKQFEADLPLKIFRSFDPTIKDVKVLLEEGGLRGDLKLPSAYKIIFDNGDSVLVDLTNIDRQNNITNEKRLSMGTYESIEIIDFLLSMRSRKNHSVTYFLDEKMAHVHSDLEIAMLSLLIENLGDNSQFFYTTHNSDVLEMNLPVHSYLFLKRNDDDTVSAIQPETIFKKNDRRLLNYVKNDVFGTLPDVSLIHEAIYE